MHPAGAQNDSLISKTDIRLLIDAPYKLVQKVGWSEISLIAIALKCFVSFVMHIW